MSQTMSCALGLLASVTACVFSTKEIIATIAENDRAAQRLWVDEYQSHACGRAISAVANFHAVALKYSGNDHEKDHAIAATEDFIRTKISSQMMEQFEGTLELTNTYCLANSSGTAIAEVYRRDRHDSRDDDPKYSYRILNPYN